MSFTLKHSEALLAYSGPNAIRVIELILASQERVAKHALQARRNRRN